MKSNASSLGKPKTRFPSPSISKSVQIAVASSWALRVGNAMFRRSASSSNSVYAASRSENSNAKTSPTGTSSTPTQNSPFPCSAVPIPSTPSTFCFPIHGGSASTPADACSTTDSSKWRIHSSSPAVASSSKPTCSTISMPSMSTYSTFRASNASPSKTFLARKFGLSRRAKDTASKIIWRINRSLSANSTCHLSKPMRA